jgi:hypothetical protein
VKRLEPPSGQAAPIDVVVGGRRVGLVGFAEEVTRRYLAEFPDDLDRYGAAVRDWGEHDTRWLLSWAALDGDGQGVDFSEQLAWLARVLDARGFPLERLARNLEIAADVIAGALHEATTPLRAGARQLRAQPRGDP